jgi:hypothetical protein
MRLPILHRFVLVRAPNFDKGGVEALLGPVLAHERKQVDRTGMPRVGAEVNQSAALCVGDPFVVDEGRAAVYDPLQQRHVVLLSFDGVGKKDIGLVVQDLFDRNFLDAEDDIPIGHARAAVGTGCPVLILAEKPLFGFLHEDSGTGFVDDFPQILRYNWCSALPAVFVFGTNQQSFQFLNLPNN